jgi:hypothetical protein
MENDMKMPPLLLLVTALVAVPAAANDIEKRAEASRNTVKEFQATLQKELQAAIKDGGAVNAIGVCSKRAPEIAADISKKNGWTVGRTSLKLRNPNSVPDAWEQKVLQLFEVRKKGGENPANIEFHEVVASGGKKEFRYMKAIPIPEGAPCLNCHGQNIDPKVQAKLKELYPKDQATGFKTGDLRGAFTIRQPM